MQSFEGAKLNADWILAQKRHPVYADLARISFLWTVLVIPALLVVERYTNLAVGWMLVISAVTFFRLLSLIATGFAITKEHREYLVAYRLYIDSQKSRDSAVSEEHTQGGDLE